MGNPRFNAHYNRNGTDDKSDIGQSGGASSADMPMKTADWPGAPGPTQGNRNCGVPKLKNAYSKAEGL